MEAIHTESIAELEERLAPIRARLVAVDPQIVRNLEKGCKVGAEFENKPDVREFREVYQKLRTAIKFL